MSKSRFKKTQHVGIRKDSTNNSYQANVTFNGKRRSKSFKRLNDAINWRRTFDPNSFVESNIKFSEAWTRFRNEHILSKATSTKNYYLRKEKNLVFFNSFKMNKITPNVISAFIEESKLQVIKTNNSKRINFDQELDILGTFFRWYRDVIDFKFQSPLIRRHRQQGKVRESLFKEKKMEYKDLKIFFDILKKDDLYWYDFACTHFFFAARVQEIAGLQISSINLKDRVVLIKDVAVWGNNKKFLELKHIPKNGEFRKIYINDILLEILTRRVKEASTDFAFSSNGRPHEYREIQYRYNKALKAVGLHPKFSGTHFLRHSMATLTRLVTGSLEATQSITGHNDQAMVQHYASMSSEVNKSAQIQVTNFILKETLNPVYKCEQE